MQHFGQDIHVAFDRIFDDAVVNRESTCSSLMFVTTKRHFCCFGCGPEVAFSPVFQPEFLDTSSC